MDSEKQGRDANERDRRLRPFLLAIALAMVAVYMLIIAAPDFGAGPSLVKILILTALGLGCGVASYVFLMPERSRRGAAETQDPLETVLNRQGFLAALGRTVSASTETGRHAALAILDIDGFGMVNRVAGEAAGTALLREVAGRLIAVAGDAALVGRVGDDEFAMIMPNAKGVSETELCARAILDCVRQAAANVPAGARPSASIGVAVAPADGVDGERLLRSATLALDAAKERGDSIRFYSRDMEMAIEARRQMRIAVEQALEEGWFELHYQPQYDLDTRRLTGFEALVRMDHPQIGFLMPSAFLPVIEEGGLLARLSSWVVETAIATAAEWPEELSLSINAAPDELREGDLAGTIAAALAACAFDGKRLRLEVSETLFADPAPEVLEQCRRLKSSGVKLVIEDFGLASSNLKAIAQAECHAIKIDRSLMSHVGDDNEADALVRSLIRTAQSFGLAVHAEGVERARQALFLVSNDCWNVQGYLFGRPVPARDLAAIIAKDFRNSLSSGKGRDGAAASA